MPGSAPGAAAVFQLASKRRPVAAVPTATAAVADQLKATEPEIWEGLAPR